MFDVGEIMPLKSSEERKDLYKSFISHKYFIFRWMTVNRNSMIDKSVLLSSHTNQRLIFQSSGHPLPLREPAPKPFSGFSCHQTLLSHLRTGFKIYLRLAATLILNKKVWISVKMLKSPKPQKIDHYWSSYLAHDGLSIYKY